MVNEYFRRFGLEIELNSFDKRNFKKDPLIPGEIPKGSLELGLMIRDLIPDSKVVLKTWHPIHNNDFWIIKPDSSCGIEICTPVFRANQDYNKIDKVINEIKNKYKHLLDDRCSFHVHVDVSDLNEMELASVLSYWIKCESVFMDSMPINRKKNRYCMLIGSLDIIQHDTIIEPNFLIKRLGSQKYFSLNTFHYSRDNRKSIEFRIAGKEFCSEPEDAINWTKLIIHFVECAKKMPIPKPYVKDDPWSSYLWLNPKEVFDLLKFDEQEKEIKYWFLNKLKNNIICENEKGIWSESARKISQVQILELF